MCDNSDNGKLSSVEQSLSVKYYFYLILYIYDNFFIQRKYDFK